MLFYLYRYLSRTCQQLQATQSLLTQTFGCRPLPVVKEYLFTEIMFESTDIGFMTPHQSRIRSTARCFACKTRRRLRQFSTLEKPYFKPSFYLLKCYFFKSLWQSNLKSIICFYIPLNPSVTLCRPTGLYIKI